MAHHTLHMPCSEADIRKLRAGDTVTLQDTLFGIRDPLGQTLSAGGGTFKVVGILRNPRGAKLAGQYDLNNLVYIPFATGNAVFGAMLPVEGSGGVSVAASELEGKYAMAWARNIWADTLA